MYKYYFRPEYGSSKLLIKFFHDVENDKFLSSLLNAISEIKPKIDGITDLWLIDEILLNVTSEMGDFSISKDIWGFAFIIAEKNQECLSRIN